MHVHVTWKNAILTGTAPQKNARRPTRDDCNEVPPIPQVWESPPRWEPRHMDTVSLGEKQEGGDANVSRDHGSQLSTQSPPCHVFPQHPLLLLGFHTIRSAPAYLHVDSESVHRDAVMVLLSF